MYLIIHGRSERSKRLLRSWVNPGPKHRRVLEGSIVAKLGPGTLMLKMNKYTIHLVTNEKGRHPSEVTLYVAHDVSTDRLYEFRASLEKMS